MNYCLTYSELSQLIDQMVSDCTISDCDLQNALDGSCNYEICLIALTYFFCRILERNNSLLSSESQKDLITLFYDIENRCFCNIEECGKDFIQFLLRNFRSPGTSLDEDLIERLNKYYDRDFRHVICM